MTWLPNQLGVVLDAMEKVSKSVKPAELSAEHKTLHDTLNERAATQLRILRKEVEELKKKFPGQDKGQFFN